MDRAGPHERGIPSYQDANKGPGTITKALGAYKEMSIFDKIKQKTEAGYSSIKKHQETSRKERMERMKAELPLREKEMSLKEREARLNARKAKLNKSGGGGAVGGIMSALGAAFGPDQSSGKRSSSRNMGPVIPNPLSDHPYGVPVKAQTKKHKKSKSKSGGQNIHIHIDK